MATFQIVRLSEGDLHIARQLAKVAGEESAPADGLSELLADRRNIVLAALQGETAIGYLIAHQFPSLSGEKLVYLYDVEVSPAYRRRGIGTAFVFKLKEACRAQGVDSIWVGSSRNNKPACALWGSTGAEQDSDQYVEFTYDL